MSFFGIMNAMYPSISTISQTLSANATTTTITASASGGGAGGTYTYTWNKSGTACTINSVSAASTTVTGSSTAGTTILYCIITNSISNISINTDNCTITWNAVVVTQNVVISGTVTYNGAAQSYVLTGTPASPAPSGTPASFTNAGTYVYPTNITSITAGSGYTLGSVSGSFTISPATISGTPANTTVTFNGSVQSATVITGVLPSGATYTGSVTASGTAVGTYSSSITGSGNYTGTVNGGTLTIQAAAVSSSISQNSPRTTTTVPCSAILNNATATAWTWARVSGTGCGFSPNGTANTTCLESGTTITTTVIQCTITYSGGTQVPQTTIQWGIA